MPETFQVLSGSLSKIICEQKWFSNFFFFFFAVTAGTFKKPQVNSKALRVNLADYSRKQEYGMTSGGVIRHRPWPLPTIEVTLTAAVGEMGILCASILVENFLLPDLGLNNDTHSSLHILKGIPPSSSKLVFESCHEMGISVSTVCAKCSTVFKSVTRWVHSF